MKAITTRTWSTPLIMGCALVVASSGVMLFYHLGEGLIKSMHEWLGLLFAFAIVLHVLNHLTPVSRYLKNTQALVVIALVLSLAGGWIAVNGSTEEHPAKRLLAKVESAPLAAVAPLQNETAGDLIARLRKAGFTVEDEQQSLVDVAQQNSSSPLAIISAALN